MVRFLQIRLALAAVAILLPFAAHSQPLTCAALTETVEEAFQQHYLRRGFDDALTAAVMRKFIEPLTQYAPHLSPEEKKEIVKLRNATAADLKSEIAAKDCSRFEKILEIHTKAISEFLAQMGSNATLKEELVKRYGELSKKPRDPMPKLHTELREWIFHWIVLQMKDRILRFKVSTEDAAALAIRHLKREYLVKPVLQPKRIPEFIAKAFFSSLDSHSRYLTAEEFRLETNDRTNNKFLLGIKFEETAKGIAITEVVKGSLAEQADIRKGDLILEANGIALNEASVENASLAIGNRLETKVTLKIARTGAETPIDFVIERKAAPGIHIEKDATNISVEAKQSLLLPMIINKGLHAIGIVKIESFYMGLAKDLKEALRVMKSANVSGVVLDLRGNPGGYLEEAVNSARLFTDAKEIVATTGPEGRTLYDKPDPNFPMTYMGPLIVLVDDGSASASELMAGALQDLKRALIVGTSNTWGKGSAQSGYVFNYEMGAYFITAKLYHLPSGRSPQRTGIKPNLVIPKMIVNSAAAVKMGENQYADAIPGADTTPFLPAWSTDDVSGIGDAEKLKGLSLDRTKQDPVLHETLNIMLDVISLKKKFGK